MNQWQGEWMALKERNNHDQGPVLSVDRSGLLRLIDQEARLLGLTGEEALARIDQGDAGKNYVWTDISLLADLLPHTK